MVQQSHTTSVTPDNFKKSPNIGSSKKLTENKEIS